MPVTVIVGVQWGDEGKAKVLDALAPETDIVVRYQGGSNAGHSGITAWKENPQWTAWLQDYQPSEQKPKTTAALR